MPEDTHLPFKLTPTQSDLPSSSDKLVQQGALFFCFYRAAGKERVGGVDLGASILRHPPSRPAPFLTPPPPNPLQFPLAVHIRHQVFV